MWLLLHPKTMSRLKLPCQAFRSVYVCQSATQPCRHATLLPTGEERCVTTLKTAVQQTIPVPAHSKSYTFSHNGWGRWDGEDGVVIIDCVAIFYEEGEGGEHYRNNSKVRCRVSRTEKRLIKLKKKTGKFASYRRGVWDSRDSWPLRYWRTRL